MPTKGSPPILETDFLPDSTNEAESYLNRGARTLSSLRDMPCVVLLGDPGIGKSDVLRKEFEIIQSSAGPNEKAIFCRVGDYADDSLIDSFFSSADFTEWNVSDAMLFLFIDGLDEGLLRDNGWVGILKRRLNDWSKPVRTPNAADKPPAIARLKLRISCRPGLWPDGLEHVLSSTPTLASANTDFKWDLLPLRRRDVRLAAEDHAINADHFLSEIERAGASSFASRPLTLKLLIQTMEDDGKLPLTHVEMFRRGCQHLIEEHNSDRRESSQRPTVTQSRRLEIARRIAAMTIFCGKPLIARTSSPELPSSSAVLTDSDIRGFQDKEDISAVELRETLDSGLFSYQDATCFRWTHPAFAAFLAAEWCNRTELSLTELRDLVLVNGAGNYGIPQQVLWTASWLCEIRIALQRFVAKTNPILLLSLDEASLEGNLKSTAIRELLKRPLAPDKVRSVMQLGGRLNHPGLAEQIRPYILNKRRKIDERHKAIDLAIACKPEALCGDLARVAVDPTEEEVIRRTAAFAVSHFGDKDSRRTLLPLALIDNQNEDRNQDLKGWSLNANWPTNLSTAEVFNVLQRENNTHYFGGYSSFLHRFARQLGSVATDEDLPAALQWVRAQTNPTLISGVNDVVAAVLVRAIRCVRDPYTRQLLAEDLIARIRIHAEPIPHSAGDHFITEWRVRLEEHPEDRRLLLLACIDLIGPKEGYFLYNVASLLRIDVADIDFLLQLAERDPKYSISVGNLLCGMGNRSEVYEAVYRGVRAGHLDQELSTILCTSLGSENAQMIKDDYLRPLKVRERHKKTSAKRWAGLTSALASSEQGKPDNWIVIWDLLWQLSEESETRWEGNPNTCDSPGWKLADEQLRERIRNAARSFLLVPRKLDVSFVGGTEFPNWAPAYYSALLLTWRIHGEVLKGVSTDTWQDWTKLALWYPFSQNDSEWTRLMEYLSGTNLQAFLAALESVLTDEIDGKQSLQVHSRMLHTWPPEVADLLFRLAATPDISGSAWASLMQWGIGSFPSRFESHIAQVVASFYGARTLPRKEIVVRATEILIRYGSGDPWLFLRDLCYENPFLSMQVFVEIGDLTAGNNFLERMSDVALGELYVWLGRLFPETEVSPTFYAGAVGSAFHLKMLRENVFASLRERGNLEVFDYVVHAFPEQKWIALQRPAAEEAYVRRRWKATSPQSLLALAEEHRMPWYQSMRGVIGIASLTTIVGIIGSAAFSEIKPAWLHYLLEIILVAAVTAGLWMLIRMRPKRTLHR